MKKFAAILLGLLCILPMTACDEEPVADESRYSIVNGGFETGDLTGWTVESGKAFSDDNVTTKSTFSFEEDENHNEIAIGQTGNWHLYGKGFDGGIPNSYTGVLRSQNFILGGTGTISMKLAGGATRFEGENGAEKPMAERCYVGVYLAENDRMIAKQENTYFLKHTTSYINPSQYSSHVYNTDNYYTYYLDLSDYLGQELYLRIVDNDTSYYYGYISVDDIRTYSEEGEQTAGAVYDKIRTYPSEAEGTEYQIANGDFETGSLAGWTVTEGLAFSNAGVNASDIWWNEGITYNRDGEYHYGMYKPETTGRMRSSEFVLGGSGYVSFKLGGCMNQSLTYLRFMLIEDGGSAIEIARFSNEKYKNFQFPYVANGMKLLNLVQYYADLSDFLGRRMYIEAVDGNNSSDELGCMTLDSVITYWETPPTFMYDSEAYELKIEVEYEPESEYQLKNGTFETGDLTGWTMEGDIGVVSDASGWWAENFPYNKNGKYLFTGIDKESGTGTLTSDAFELGGSGWMTFSLGGGGNPALCYVSVLDAQTGEELARFGNLLFNDQGTGSLNINSFLANMVSYKVDLTSLGIEKGTSIRIRLTDNATSNWGLLTADSFITYYESADSVPQDAHLAKDILPAPATESDYQITNGGFETGDLTGWTVTSGEVSSSGAVSSAQTFWGEGLPYNANGLFHFDGWGANGNETETYTLASETFTLGGSGFISFKLGGRSAVLRVCKEDGTPIAEYGNTMFSVDNFPYVDQGCRTATMTTYAADLSAYLGERLYVEICDVALDGQDWGIAFFDDIVTYYETAPDVETLFDTVDLNAKTSSDGIPKSYRVPWEIAVNRISE